MRVLIKTLINPSAKVQTLLWQSYRLNVQSPPLQIPTVFTPSDHKNLNTNYCWSSALSRPGILNIAGPLPSWHPAQLSNEIPIGKQYKFYPVSKQSLLLYAAMF
jgi:hypothetical protein